MIYINGKMTVAQPIQKTMKIEVRPISEIKPYENNPRNITGIDSLCASLREFGFRQPLVVNADGVIVVGHRRYFAAQKIGLTEIPVHVAHDLTPAQIKAYRLADNRLAEDGVWNHEMLMGELSELSLESFDFAQFGFDDNYLLPITEAEKSAKAKKSKTKTKLRVCPNCHHEFKE